MSFDALRASRPSEVSEEQAAKAVALLFGGSTLPDSAQPVRRHLGFPGMFSKAALASTGPISQGISGTSNSIQQPLCTVILK